MTARQTVKVEGRGWHRLPWDGSEVSGRAGGEALPAVSTVIIVIAYYSNPDQARLRPAAGERRSLPGGDGLSSSPATDAMPFAYTTNLSEVRDLADKHARMAGLPDARVTDFVIAVSEVAANSIRHARSPGTMEIWCSAGEIICEIRDAGVIADPQAGRRPPLPGANGGHGLWLVHQVCDRVDLRSDQGGTVIRMHMSLP